MATVTALGRLAFFEGMPPWACEHLERAAREREFEPGALVVRQLDEARSVHFLVEGRLQVLVHYEGAGDLLMGTLTDPDTLVGWSAFRAPYRYTASVRCEQRARTLVVPREAFEAVFEEDPLLAYETLKRIVATIDARLEGTLSHVEPSSTGRWASTFAGQSRVRRSTRRRRRVQPIPSCRSRPPVPAT